jgi:hypothetical protein
MNPFGERAQIQADDRPFQPLARGGNDLGVVGNGVGHVDPLYAIS